MSLLYTSDLTDFIDEQSNLKCMEQNIKKPTGITKEEIKKFLGIFILM